MSVHVVSDLEVSSSRKSSAQHGDKVYPMEDQAGSWRSGSRRATEVSQATRKFLVVTISNPRSGEVLAQPEACFIPFHGSSATTGAWKPVESTPQHVSRMRDLWLTGKSVAAASPKDTMPRLVSHHSGPVKTTTGLGLPLCRAFAHAAGGWLALDDSQQDGMTHFWCVLEADAVGLQPTLFSGASSRRRLSSATSSSHPTSDGPVHPDTPAYVTDACHTAGDAWLGNIMLCSLWCVFVDQWAPTATSATSWSLSLGS